MKECAATLVFWIVTFWIARCVRSLRDQLTYVTTSSTRTVLCNSGYLNVAAQMAIQLSGWTINAAGESFLALHRKRFFPDITQESFSAALDREPGYLKEEISEKPSSEWRNVPMYRAIHNVRCHSA